MEKDARIYVAGHRGLVGSAILRRLKQAGFTRLLCRTSRELDLTCQAAVRDFFESERPAYVFLAAAKVGGIHANNTYPADFIHANLAIQTHVIRSAFDTGVRRLLFLGSSCIYPKRAPQPMKETHLMTGPLEPTNSAYAVAKIAGIETCRAFNRQHGTCFLPVMPTNLYGPRDNFDLENSHVLPALIRKFHLAKLARQGNWTAIGQDEARFGPIPDDLKMSLGIGNPSAAPEVILWGTGTPRREFLHVDDLADACLHVMETVRDDDATPLSEFLVNIGTGEDLTIRALAEQIARIVGFDGPVVWDPEKPDGTPRKLLDVSRLHALGWQAKIGLEEGIRRTYDWYRSAGANGD